MRLPCKIKRLSDKATIPSLGSTGAAGYDLSSAADVIVPSHDKKLILLDLALVVPTGHYFRIAPRSGLAFKHDISVEAGVVDEDYRGNVGVILRNHGNTDFVVKIGDKIAQGIYEQISHVEYLETEELDETERGEKGYGSTDKPVGEEPVKNEGETTPSSEPDKE